MSEPAAQNASPPGASPPAGDPAASPAPTRPEYLPETFWDPAANAVKPEFGQHYTEISTFHKTQTEAAKALEARKPEDIKLEVKLPDNVKVPDGLDLKIDPKDPLYAQFIGLAQQAKLPQEQIDALVAFEAQRRIAEHNAELTRVADEDKKLGANAKDRKAAVSNWLKGLDTLTAAEREAVAIYASDALTVTALEKIMAKAAGSVPGNGGNPPPPPKPGDTPMENRWYGPQQKAS